MYVLDKKTAFDLKSSLQLNNLRFVSTELSLEQILSGKHEVTIEFFRFADDLKLLTLSDVSSKDSNHVDSKIIIDRKNLINNIRSLLSELEVNQDSLDKYLRKIQLRFFESQIKIYDDSINNSKKDHETNLENLISQRTAFEKLVKDLSYFQNKLNSVDQQIQKLHGLFQNLDLKKYVEDLKVKRLMLVNQKLRNPTIGNIHSSSVDEKLSEFDSFVGEGILILSFVQILVATLFFVNLGFVKENIIFSTFYLIFNFFSFLIFNKLRFKQKFERFLDSSESQKYEFEKLVGTLSKETVEKVKQISYLEALNYEKKIIEKSMNFLSGGKSVDELKITIEELDKKINESVNLDDRWIIDEDQYYYCKREINLLKLEVDDYDAEIEVENLNKFASVGDFLSKLHLMKDEYMLPLFIQVDSGFDYNKDFDPQRYDIKDKQIIFISFA